jgi:hypothetical protein
LRARRAGVQAGRPAITEAHRPPPSSGRLSPAPKEIEQRSTDPSEKETLQGGIHGH